MHIKIYQNIYIDTYSAARRRNIESIEIAENERIRKRRVGLWVTIFALNSALPTNRNIL